MTSSVRKPVSQLPLIKVDSDAFRAWIEDDLISADAVLSKDPGAMPVPRHQVLANRALVRARRQQWNAALDAAEEVMSCPYFQRCSFSCACPTVARDPVVACAACCEGPRTHRSGRVSARARIL